MKVMLPVKFELARSEAWRFSSFLGIVLRRVFGKFLPIPRYYRLRGVTRKEWVDHCKSYKLTFKKFFHSLFFSMFNFFWDRAMAKEAKKDVARLRGTGHTVWLEPPYIARYIDTPEGRKVEVKPE